MKSFLVIWQLSIRPLCPLSQAGHGFQADALGERQPCL